MFCIEKNFEDGKNKKNDVTFFGKKRLVLLLQFLAMKVALKVYNENFVTNLGKQIFMFCF